jgi:hypothetical protein
MADPLEEMFGTKEKKTKKKAGQFSEKEMKRLRAFAKRDDRIMVALDAYENGDFSPAVVKELIDVIKDRQDRGKNATEAKKQAADYDKLLQKILGLQFETDSEGKVVIGEDGKPKEIASKDGPLYTSATGLTGSAVDSMLGGIVRKASSVFDRDGRTIGGDLAQLQRIKGAEFEKAFETLRGGGAVSNVEGATMLQKFTSLFDENGNLRKDMSEEEFKAEVERLRSFTQESLGGFDQKYTFDPETGDILTTEEYAELYDKAPAIESDVPEANADGSLSTGQTEDTMLDLTPMSPVEQEAQWKALPVGTIVLYNGKKVRKNQ